MRRLLLLFLIILLFCIVSCGDSRVEDVFYQQAEGVSGELELIERGTGTGLSEIVEEMKEPSHSKRYLCDWASGRQ